MQVGAPSLLLAFAAGIVSFVSPCCLPLVPGYLAVVSGRGQAASGGRRIDPRVTARALMFVATFSLIFVLLGLSATLVGSLLDTNKQLLSHISGVFIVAMGALLVASVFALRLNREFRPSGLIERAGRGGPVLAGAAFAIAWTPCVGPALGAILSLAANTSGTAQGALLLSVYSAGLALPFLISAVAFDSASRAFGVIKRHHAAIQVGSGLVLVAMGYLVMTNQLFRLNIEAQHLLGHFGLNFFQSV